MVCLSVGQFDKYIPPSSQQDIRQYKIQGSNSLQTQTIKLYFEHQHNITEG